MARTVTFGSIPEIPVPGRPLGRTILHDSESRRYPVMPRATAELKSVKYERHIPILDQDNWYDPTIGKYVSLGSCTGNAATGALGTGPLWDALVVALGGKMPTLDEDFAVEKVYGPATHGDPFGGAWRPNDTGSNGLSVAKVVKDLGLISGYQHALGLQAFQSGMQAGPMIAGITWKTGCDTPTREGIVRWSGTVRGGHEIVFDELDLQRGLAWFANSWTESWGVKGRAAFPLEDLGKAFEDDGDATAFVPLTSAPPVPQDPIITGPDAILVPALRAWRPGILSKVTKAGQLADAADRWMAAKGYR